MKEKTMINVLKLSGFFFIILFVLVAIVLGPLATIAALNTVFSLQIAYTFWTWLGVLWLQWLFVVPKFNAFKK